MKSIRFIGAFTASAIAMLAFGIISASAMAVVQTTDGTTLLNSLVTNASGFSSLTATYAVGDAAQVGTYSGFSSGPVTTADGVVLSTGNAVDTVGPASFLDNPNTVVGGGSTAEIDAYAPGHVANWDSSYDAAVLQVDFGLASSSAVAFDFLFGSIEYPNFVNEYTDAMYAFLDGQQISFDTSGNAVQVGSSFANLLTTADTNSAFGDPHGLLGPLTTMSPTLAAGSHTLRFEVADTNDGQLDSALFLSNFRTTTNDGGASTGATEVPEPGSLGLIGVGFAALGFLRRRRRV